ncbi:uncharacterized protein BDV17DRAFT_216558 [Aspergillus undulatus]|uniref:uncharacterized protein n=1 Tax=Aspergillus undulatus TaxID=1810928 RepID=UPI003CCDDB2E
MQDQRLCVFLQRTWELTSNLTGSRSSRISDHRANPTRHCRRRSSRHHCDVTGLCFPVECSRGVAATSGKRTSCMPRNIILSLSLGTAHLAIWDFTECKTQPCHWDRWFDVSIWPLSSNDCSITRFPVEITPSILI